MVDLLCGGGKKTKEASLGTAMCPAMHTKTISGAGDCDSQQAAASASFNAGARAPEEGCAGRATLFVAFGWFFSEFLLFPAPERPTQCGPTGNKRPVESEP